jgi:DNA-binding XRE family transcriptional regulator
LRIESLRRTFFEKSPTHCFYYSSFSGGNCCTMTTAVGHNIRRIRKGRGYSQSALAELARTSQSWICRIERGNENPSLASVTRIAGALQVDVLDLLRAPAGEAA